MISKWLQIVERNILIKSINTMDYNNANQNYVIIEPNLIRLQNKLQLQPIHRSKPTNPTIYSDNLEYN